VGEAQVKIQTLLLEYEREWEFSCFSE
jgi:hypothetical protein